MEANRKTKGRSGRLGTRMRGKLQDAYNKRGHGTSYLWYAYSSHTDSDWIFNGALERAHFLLMEANSLIQTVDYAPEPIILIRPGREVLEFQLKATAIMRDGSTEWHYIVRDAAEGNVERDEYAAIEVEAVRMGVRVVRWSLESLFADTCLLANWHNINSWLGAARDRSMHQISMDVYNLLEVRRSVVLGDLIELCEPEELPLYIAAAFRAVQCGEILSDTNSVLVSDNTVFYLLE